MINEQTRHKLTLFDGEAKRSKIKSTIKRRSKRVSIAIAKATNRDVAFKGGKMSEAAFETQAAFVLYFRL